MLSETVTETVTGDPAVIGQSPQKRTSNDVSGISISCGIVDWLCIYDRTGCGCVIFPHERNG